MSTTQSVPYVSAPGFKVAPKVMALALPALLLLGFALRLGASMTQTHVLFFDETIQYFEQGHRLAFGSGVVPWEFADGVRSWLLPGLISLVMFASSLVSDNPMLYVGLVRAICVALSLVIVLIGFRVGERRFGRLGALVTGGFCAIWFDLIYFAPAVMTEVLAAHCAILALFVGERTRTPRQAYWCGALFGIAVCLRYQYAPALVLAGAWQFRRSLGLWQWLLLGSASVLLPFAGVLDAITWGMAFQSIWLNFVRNSLEGIAAAIGTESPVYYLQYLIVAMIPLPLLLGLAAFGARRFPALAIAALTVLITHSLVAHKEVRFIYLTLAAAPILIGLGASEILSILGLHHGAKTARYGAAAFLCLGAGLSWYIATGPLAGRWSFQRGTVNAFLAAHAEPELCGLQVRDIPSWKSGGYTYLNRDVPLMFEPHIPEVRLPNVSMPLHFSVEWQRGPVPQLRSPYSHVIAEAARRPQGFDIVACFPEDARTGEPELCLFRRPNGCS